MVRFRLLVLTLAAIGLSACSGSSEVREASHGPASEPTVQPSGVDFCNGVTTVDDAVDLVTAGLGRVAGRVVVGEAKGPVNPDVHTLEVPVLEFAPEAGSLRAGPIKEIEVSAIDLKDNVLPEGEYFVLLGETPIEGRYFLSSGIEGSFYLADDGQVQQRCSMTKLNKPVPETDLVGWLDEAISKVWPRKADQAQRMIIG
jgi:hypothetical protein